MAYTVGTGPPETDAVHQWSPGIGVYVGTAINDRVTDPPTYPWIKLLRVNGWRSRPEREDNRAPRTFGEGEIAYQSRRLGKTLVYEIECRAQTRESILGLATGVLNTYDQSADDEDGAEGTMTVTPYAGIGGPVWTWSGRCIDVQMDPTWNWNPRRNWRFSWPGTISFRMSDPRFYTGGTGYL